MARLQEMSTWDFIQLVLLFLFFISFFYRSIGLRIQKKINPIKWNFGENRFLGILELSLFLSVSIWAIEVVFYSIPSKTQIFPWPFSILLLDSILTKWIGLFLSFLAFGLLFSGLKNLGDSWRFGIDENQAGKLVTRGIYSVTRNPIYLFFNLWFLGTFLIHGTLVFLCFTLFTILNLHCQIIKEEEFLQIFYGSEFNEYCRRTPRYFSWEMLSRNKRSRPQVSSESFSK